MKCANAGHEYPAIMHKGGSFELFKIGTASCWPAWRAPDTANTSLELDAGDRLVVHMDGVPEATNASNTLYGTDRMPVR